MEEIKTGKADYQFVEIMACPGGCIMGGGQPIKSSKIRAEVDVRKLRADALYTIDEKKVIRKSHENPVIKELYKEPYSYLINMLITGPENEKLESAIPEGTKVNSCTLKGNTVYVDLSKEFIDNAPSGITEESMVVYSIVNTLTELNEVSGVKFLINGSVEFDVI